MSGRRSVREAVIARLADECAARVGLQSHPLRVGIDGRSNAGKSHLADELVAELLRHEQPALRVSIDEFHRKGHKFRSQRGECMPESRLAEGPDYVAFRDWVLVPTGPDGSRRIRPRMLDSANDEYWPEEWVALGANTVVVSDAAHGFMPELVELWDYRIWLEVSAETMISRATGRDIAWAGSREEVRRRYEAFWVPMDAYYLAVCDPVAAAHCVIDNNDFEQPVILRI